MSTVAGRLVDRLPNPAVSIVLAVALFSGSGGQAQDAVAPERASAPGRNYPRIGSSYIFFVEQTPKQARWTSGNAEGLHIITAYEVQGGRVYALDRDNQAGGLPYEKYDGIRLNSFLSALTAGLIHTRPQESLTSAAEAAPVPLHLRHG